ncbi:putative moz protein represents a chromatin-associated acetyltransferase protein [Phaeoacremonium minimum UCRPA7]|uniref:Putative moz protein represents a chromatin-associated acetyltransferase protein n=1 Tax=Phaeoacremonium minimum (strain UCR-PA7) TaxID=1286976 RepID=R8BS92_PHAM7|nr:putative moz protein represents a chromatin-associated acetyltransferase protein [Phaeoacremonium minimum UCRPA7]EOO02248.1 putative moz protein represents a chromatin-associated acetyltransferase protein [Phaeoacremonium minimum UCRPA7]
MSTVRLTFLYPQLFRSARVGESAAAAHAAVRARAPRAASSASRPRRQRAAPFSTTSSAKKSAFAPRVGKAVEPRPLGDTQAAPALEAPGKVDDAAPPASSESPAAEETRESTPEQKKDAAQKLDPAVEPKKETLSLPGESSKDKAKDEDKAKEQDKDKEDAATQDASGKKKGGGSGPMDAILHLEPPESKEHKPPHLTPPPYVHHFDSYSLVKQLEVGGYTQDQAITAMKAVRAILAQNLDVAQDSLVSKSDVENETYLFRAACSELSTEIKNSSRVADEQLRQQRTLLQHEVDILTQTLNQELLTLNDNVRGMFNDRKMAVREEQKAAESAIQQINYKISVILNSDSRSEIEGVRWVLIRRSVLGIIFMAILTLGTLRYSSYLGHERQKEAEQKAKEAETLRMNAGRHDQSSAPDAAEILAAN